MQLPSEEDLMEFIVLFNQDARGLSGSVMSREVPRKRVFVSRTYAGVMPVHGESWRCLLESDTKPGQKAGALIVKPLASLVAERKKQQEILDDLAERTERDFAGVIGKPGLGDRLTLKLQGMVFVGMRYTAYPNAWAKNWGLNSPQEYRKLSAPQRGKIILDHFRVDTVIAGFEKALKGVVRELYLNPIEREAEAANDLAKEIEGRLPPTRFIGKTTPGMCSLDYFTTTYSREDGLRWDAMAEPGEMDRIRTAKARKAAYQSLWSSMFYHCFCERKFGLGGEKLHFRLTLSSGKNTFELEGESELELLPETIAAKALELLSSVDKSISVTD